MLVYNVDILDYVVNTVTIVVILLIVNVQQYV